MPVSVPRANSKGAAVHDAADEPRLDGREGGGAPGARPARASRMRMLITFHASECTDSFAAGLQHAGLPLRADVLVLPVAEQWFSGLDAGAGLSLTAQSECAQAASTQARKVQAQLAAAFPEWSIVAEAATGSLVDNAIRRGGEWNAGLIVLGPVGKPAWGRSPIGPIARKIANEAACSVRVYRDKPPSKNGGARILIAYDGQPGSELAVKAVLERNWPADTQAVLLTSVGFGYSPVAGFSLVVDYARARAVQAHAETMLRNAGMEVLPVVHESDPNTGIADVADAFDVDCIFIGHNDRHILYRVFVGTVASSLISRARCSVEIVRAGPRATEDAEPDRPLHARTERARHTV